MIDPLLIRIISLGFALLFLVACAHKFSNRLQFRANFVAYEIVPARLSPLVANLIPPLELLLGIAWLALGIFTIKFDIIILVSSGLLTSYALAIGINLMRGRNHIDCGCGFSNSNASNSDAGSQLISPGLFYRNALLALLAAVCLVPASDRSLHLIDAMGILFSLISLILIYGAYNQILNNRSTIDSWRKKHA